jgi:uncharacterized short protein YbdD (DUF466 family)
VKAALVDRFASAVSTVKRIVGMPNYEAYVAHLRDHHPECAIPTEREYYNLYLEGRYKAGGSRCC